MLRAQACPQRADRRRDRRHLENLWIGCSSQLEPTANPDAHGSMRSTSQSDLFAALTPAPVPFTPTREQSTKPWYDPAIGWQMDVPSGGHHAHTIRQLAHAILDDARAATALHWNPRQIRKHTATFPYLAEWLKGGEGDQLMLEFKAEMDRLHAPVDQVAPNWRRIWKLAA